MKTPPYQIGHWLMGMGFLVLAQQCFVRGQGDLGWLAVGFAVVWWWTRREEKKARRRTRRPGGWHPDATPATRREEGKKPATDPVDPEEVVYDIKVYKYPDVRRAENSL